MKQAAVRREAILPADTAPSRWRASRPVAALARGVAAALSGLLLLLGAFLLWRRLSGALAYPLEPLALVLVGTLVASAAAAARLVVQDGPAQRHAVRRAWLVSAILSAAVLMVGLALSLRRTSPGGLIVFWGLLAAEECCAWGPAGWRRLRLRWVRSSDAGPEASTDRHPSRPPGAAGFPQETRSPPAGDVVQQLTRRRRDDGSEAVTGWLRVPIAAGQRSASVHVAFCPPFLRNPTVQIDQLEGPEARIRTVQLLPYGARFDLKLAAFREGAATVLLEFSAQAAPPAAHGPLPADRDVERS